MEYAKTPFEYMDHYKAHQEVQDWDNISDETPDVHEPDAPDFS